MNDLIKDVIEKIKLWFKNIFKKKKKLSKSKQSINLSNDSIKKEKYVVNFSLSNENKSSAIGTFYPKLSQKNKFLLRKKTNILRKNVLGLDIKENNLNIDIVDSIIETINNNNIYINQAIEINALLNNINNDAELELNVNEKLNILKDNISTIIDKKLDNYEQAIIKKAYNEYNKVNYVIMTTLFIDDIIDEINELNEDFKKNKYTKIEYEKKISKIKDKISKLETINNRREVQEEIENLRKDFYTKKKDKYDLLYNEEIFINLNNKCDELLKIVNDKQKELINNNRTSIEKKEKIEKQKKDEKALKKTMEQEERNQREKEYNENILKRFIDMEFAHKLILLREKNRRILKTKDEIVYETINYYNDFIIGESREFNFDRNRVKTEIIKLYNDITSVICTLEKREFQPLENINVKLEALTESTLEKQVVLNNLIEERHNYKISETDSSKNATDKLTNILAQERTKQRKDQKVLKKDHPINQSL